MRSDSGWFATYDASCGALDAVVALLIGSSLFAFRRAVRRPAQHRIGYWRPLWARGTLAGGLVLEF
jgi:hypothetical protein